MFGLANAWAFLTEHPVIGFAVFVAVSFGVLLVLSGGKLGDSLGAMLRVAILFFTTPFVFLRDALTIIRNAQDDEQGYQQSRVFMLFRLSKLQYLGLLVWCLLILSGGITTNLISLYPSYEIEQGRQLDQRITELQSQEEGANQAVASAGAPDHRAQLDTQRTEAQSAYRRQVQGNADFVQSTTFSGNNITQLANASSMYTVNNVRSNLDYYMSSCPRGYTWRGMTADSCARYREFVIQLADRKEQEFTLQAAAVAVEEAFQQADQAAAVAANNLANVQAQLQATREQRAAVSVFNPEAMGRRAMGAIGGILMTLFSVIVALWLGATAISFFSWLILMMRGLEAVMTQRVNEVRPNE